MGPRLRRLWFPVTVAALGAASYACSLITSYDGLAGGGAQCSCLDPLPPGWIGPVALFDSTGTPPAAPPACSGAYGTEQYSGSAGPMTQAGSCSCSCSVGTAPGCSGNVAATFYTGSCGAGGCGDAEAPPGTCLNSPGCGGGSLYIGLGAVAPSGGTCDAHPNPLPSPTWSEMGEVCSPAAPPTQGSCAAGQTCAPRPPAGFQSGSCIFKTGDVACPGAPFLTQHLFYADFDDMRSCPCSCGTPQSAACNASVRVYAPGACTTLIDRVDVGDAGCTFLSPTNAPVTVEYTSEGGACAPASAQITGTVTGKSPTTVCCSN